MAAMLLSAAAPGSTAVPSSQTLDEEGQQHLEVQQHAAAVQLLNRSLAVAHLRAELIKPKGGDVAVQPKERSAGIVVKLEPGMQPAEHMQQPPQQQSVWQLPQQPQEQRGARPGIVFNISSNNPDGQMPAADSMQQVPTQRRPATLTSQARKRPDAVAASSWLQSEQSGDLVGPAGFTSKDQTPPAPRIVADAAQRAQGMAHWVHVGAEGATGQVAEQPGDMHAAAVAPGMIEAAPLQPEEDLVDEDRDEEEWI